MVIFATTDGQRFRMYHSQDCCESVAVEDIAGSLDDLIGSPLTMAEETSRDDPEASDSGTWTFYRLATAKGYVTIRWYGSSNDWAKEG